MPTVSDNDRTLGSVVRDLTEHISRLVRSEIALLKLEFMDMFAKLGGGIGMFAGALFLALCGIAFLFVTITLGLVALGVPAWLSTLIVTIALFAGAGVFAFLGRKKFAGVQFVPKESMNQIKSDIETLKNDIGSRVRSR